MKLYLVRHAEAVGPEIDIRRPLSEIGRNNAALLGNYLAKAHIEVGHIFQSDKLRSQQTAEILANSLGIKHSLTELPQLDRADSIEFLTAKISGCTNDALLVGHIPVLPRLLGELVVQNENALLVDFHPATIVCLQRLDFARWVIEWVLSPAILR